MSDMGWSIYRLGDLAEKITKGTTPTTLGHPFVESGINFIKAESIQMDGSIDSSKFVFIDSKTHNKLKRSQIEENDILFSMAGMVLGKTAVAKKEFLPANTNQALAVIRLRKNIADPQYVAYFMRQKLFFNYVNQSTGQSAQPNINLEEIGNLEITLPNLPTQTRIATILSALDDKIELNRRTNTTLETIAQAIFKEWFVDFRFPGATGEMQDSELGPIPKGWRPMSIYETAEFVNGAAYKETDFSYDHVGFPVIKIAELKYGITGQTRFSEILKNKKCRIENGDILFSWSGSPDTSIDTFIWAGNEGVLNQHIFKVITTHAKKYYQYYLLKNLKPILIEIARDKQTTGLGHVTVQDMKRIKIAYPEHNLIEIFEEKAGPIFKQYLNNELQSASLANIRNTLLPKLMSGEIEV